MNTDRTDTRSPHLGLEDLIAEVTGQVISDQARDHLAACERCLAEASRWDMVSDGVRVLAASAPEVAQPGWPLEGGQREPAAGRRRTRLAVGAAAALVLLAGASYGATAAVTGHAPGTARNAAQTPGAGTSATALTAVSGCAGLKQADGTLEQVSGTRLVIKTGSGQPVTVTTTASTMASVGGAPLSDITDGARVTVVGLSSDGTIAAQKVGVGSPFKAPLSANVAIELPPGWVGVLGTVADASTSGFTVVTSSGTRTPVTTSSATQVHVLHASLSEFRVGARTVAAGYLGAGGTLSAAVIVQLGPKQATKMQLHLDVGGCSPASIGQAYTSAFGS
jgi:hypothetical protein